MQANNQTLEEYFDERLGDDIKRYKAMRAKQVASWERPRNMKELRENNPDD